MNSNFRRSHLVDNPMLLKCICAIDGGVRITTRAQARAKRDLIHGFTEINNELVLCISISAPPVDGQANAAIEKLIAKTMNVSTSSVHVVRGTKSRIKLVDVYGVTQKQAIERLFVVLEAVY